jgi:hypothetical protein
MITTVIKTITRTAKNTTENGVQGSATRIDAKYIIRGRIPRTQPGNEIPQRVEMRTRHAG